MGQDPLDDLRLLDAREHSQTPAAARAPLGRSVAAYQAAEVTYERRARTLFRAARPSVAIVTRTEYQRGARAIRDALQTARTMWRLNPPTDAQRRRAVERYGELRAQLFEQYCRSICAAHLLADFPLPKVHHFAVRPSTLPSTLPKAPPGYGCNASCDGDIAVVDTAGVAVVLIQLPSEIESCGKHARAWT